MKIEFAVKVKNPLGLHTRPATNIVRALQKTKCKVTFTYKKQTINAKSILSILLLAATRNSTIIVNIDGDDADEIYNQVKSLDTIFQQKSYEEIKNLLDSHFFGKEVSSTSTQTVDAEEDDDKTFEDVKPIVEKPTPVLSEQEKKVQDILKDL
jgi:phosphocarrier protein